METEPTRQIERYDSAGTLEQTPEQLSLFPRSESHSVAVHEVMHGIVAEWYSRANVQSIDVKKDGPVLGRTCIRASHPAIAATGLVHGEGYGSDLGAIVMDAKARGANPALAVHVAREKAQQIISQEGEDVIDLVARKLGAVGEMSGDEFRQTVDQARAEIEFGDFDQPVPEESIENDATGVEDKEFENTDQVVPLLGILVAETVYETHEEIAVSIDGVFAGSVNILPGRPNEKSNAIDALLRKNNLHVTLDEVVFNGTTINKSGIIYEATPIDRLQYA